MQITSQYSILQQSYTHLMRKVC
uniref:Uncharacterized protein n=1 Tax=Rhizophora mucronata TaxID=61149 RepID=A0A2P2P470_RHIMU